MIFLTGSMLFGSVLSSHGYLQAVFVVTMFTSVWLAFFNMLPIYPLDGSKVLRWNKAVYAVTLMVIFAFLYYIAGIAIVSSLIFALFIALVFYFFFSSGMHIF